MGVVSVAQLMGVAESMRFVTLTLTTWKSPKSLLGDQLGK